MLSDELRAWAVPAELESWDAEAIEGGECAHNELSLRVRSGRIADVCRYLKEHLEFTRLVGVTAIDRSQAAEPRFEVVYLLHSIARNERLRLKAAVGGDSPELPSVCAVWAGANWYEREAFDMFGIRFTGHPDLRRILMPDYWDGHPLRKDFPVDGHKYDYQGK